MFLIAWAAFWVAVIATGIVIALPVKSKGKRV